MRIALSVLIGVFCSVTPLTQAIAQQFHINKKVAVLQGFYDGADCIYFKLEGVAQADPIKPNEATFAIANTQFNAKNAYAMLLAAKLSGQAVRVTTRSQLTCGYAAVAEIIIE